VEPERQALPLTSNGEAMARKVGVMLHAVQFDLVLVSPLRRARQTCELAGFAARARVTADLAEWHYGEYEGLTTPEIRQRRPDWSLWRDGCPEGETAQQVARRVDRVLNEARAAGGNSLLFAHGHVLRVLTARWLALHGRDGMLFALSTGTASVLGY
jgi:probable phosphoglycerate mutase